jgi:flavin-dependent dehydrogenase
MTSQEGKQWTHDKGLSTGLPTISVVSPPSYKTPSSSTLVDVIVIGAGYAGLIAARDLAIQGEWTIFASLAKFTRLKFILGHSVFLIEARDRIGGRTWHSTIDGFNYEMGGTWIHWHMPHIYREVSLYGMNDDWIVTPTTGGKHDYCTIGSRGLQRNVNHVEEVGIDFSFRSTVLTVLPHSSYQCSLKYGAFFATSMASPHGLSFHGHMMA